jgi:anti-sigma-K factor RskA
MKDENVHLIDLLIKQATEGLNEAEAAELLRIESTAGGPPDPGFDLTAAAIDLVDMKITEQIPADLHKRIIADSERFFADREKTAVLENEDRRSALRTDVARRGSFGEWLGWAVAVAACFALVINLWLTRIQPAPGNISQVQMTPAPAEELSPQQQRQRLLDTAGDVILANVGAGNMPGLKNISGDIVWSDSKQAGYMRFRGLPSNDKNKETYQLWIFDETQDPKTPIDGGTFDVDQDGEVVIPINARLKARQPKLFAVTVEKPGGVVVSKQEKVAALAKARAS